jgi:molybdopterin-guanine dinucleotide biosynthesis protein A
VQQSVSAADVLFIEGRKSSHIPKLLLLDPRYEMEEAVAGIDGTSVLAVVYPHGEVDRATALARTFSGPEDRDRVPVYCRDDLAGITAELDAYWAARTAPLRGLVLVGGKSTRMGRDKSGIEYRNGVSAARRSVNILAAVCDTVSLAVRRGQHVPDDVAGVPRIEDRFVDFGPAGAILTALHHDPTAAWLTVGCDMPLLGEDDVQELVAHRDPFKIATSAAGPGYARMREEAFSPDGKVLLPEPLCSIWEPRSRGRIFSFFQEGVTAPRWMLRNGAVKMVELSNTWATYNANTPEDVALARLAVNPRTRGDARPGRRRKTPGTPTRSGSAPV